MSLPALSRRGDRTDCRWPCCLLVLVILGAAPTLSWAQPLLSQDVASSDAAPDGGASSDDATPDGGASSDDATPQDDDKARAEDDVDDDAIPAEADGPVPGARLKPPRPSTEESSPRVRRRPERPVPMMPPGLDRLENQRQRPAPEAFFRPVEPRRYLLEDGDVPSWVDNSDRRHIRVAGVDGGLAFTSDGGVVPVGRVDFVRVSVPFDKDYREHDRLFSFFGELAAIEPLPLNDDDEGDFAWDVLLAALQFDSRYVGVYLGAQIFNVVGLDANALSPAIGLRFGLPEYGQGILEVRFKDLYAVTASARPRSMAHNVDARLQGEWLFAELWRAQLRARFRDITSASPDSGLDGSHLRDLTIVAGVEVGGPIGLRFTPVFLGLGVRHVFANQLRAEGVTRELEPAGLQPVLWLNAELGLHSVSALW